MPVGVVFQNKHIYENLRLVLDFFFTFWIKRNGKWLWETYIIHTKLLQTRRILCSSERPLLIFAPAYCDLVFVSWLSPWSNLNLSIYIKEILQQFLVKNFFPWKFNLEYDGTFTKLSMHVSSRNMFPTIRNLQIRLHVYRPHHCCGDWLTFGCLVPVIADHDLVTKR